MSLLPKPRVLQLPHEGWRPHQEDAIWSLIDSPFRVSGLVAPTGCLTGDTRVQVNRAFNSKRPTLAVAYQRQESGDPKRRADILSLTRSFNGKEIRLHPFESIVARGRKPTWRIRLSNGFTLRGTFDHRVMTESGYIALADLGRGDRVMCDTRNARSVIKRPPSKPLYYQRQGLFYHPYANGVVSKREGRLYRAPLHRLVVEAHLNGLPLETFISICRTQRTAASSLTFLDPEVFAVHHKNENSFDNRLDNLEVLTHEAHRLEHADHHHFNQGIPTYSAVVSSEATGRVESVYDLLACEPFHNFVANGIVVHNSGKTSTAFALAFLSKLQAEKPDDYRVVVLTGTRALQDQYASYGVKLADVRGQSHYVCVAEPRLRVSEGFCHLGPRCELRDQGCHYYDAIRTATKSAIMVTNYSWWLARSLYAEAYPVPHLLVMDEAHAADADLSEALAVTITGDEIRHFLHDDLPGKGWVRWAQDHRNRVGAEWDQLKTDGTALQGADRKRAFKLRDLHRKLTRLSEAGETEGWVMETTPKSVRWDVAWPGPYAEELLFRGSPRVVLMSAVLRDKTMQLLGLKKGGYDLHEWPSSFPVDRRPVSVVPTVRLRYDSDPALLTLWIARLDQIIDRRLDRKGILHTVSYRRRDELMARSRHRALMMTHRPGELDSCIQKFKQAAAPCLLVSPAVTTGVDFPYSECEYSVVCKVPFPDSRSRILKARQAADKEYGLYLAVMEIVQAAGRGMRAADDRHEVLIIDDQIRWVLVKYKHLFPNFFLQAVKWEDGVPNPPPKL